MKYSFYIIGCDEIPDKGNVAFGLGFTLRHIVQWEYNMDWDNLTIHQGLVSDSFHYQFRQFIRQHFQELLDGDYKQTNESTRTAIRIISDKDFRKVLIGER